MTDPTQPVTFDYRAEREAYKDIISEWNDEKRKCQTRRDLRENRVNVEEMRQSGAILNDETIIPDRTINTNIRMGRVPYAAYITQSKRMLIVTDISAPQISIEPLELWFTRGMRYPKWKNPWLKLIDAFHVHGGAALEVIYDVSKPFNASIEFIPRESLLFPVKTRNLQACPRILRTYDLTTLQLEEFTASYNFDPNISKDLQEKFKKATDFITVYRVLCKKDGLVYNAWFSNDCEKDWLRPPMLHDVGLINFDKALLTSPTMIMTPEGPQQIPFWASPEFEQQRGFLGSPLALKNYPVIWFPYEMTENEELLRAQGRVALDHHVQEAMTHMLTNTVNASTRASALYAYAINEPGNDPGMRELGKLKPGEILGRELGIFQPPWPNNIILSLMEAMRVNKANEAGHSDFAAMARKDANKTATEMELATDSAQMIKTVDMDVYSSPVLDTLALCFQIATHQAIFGLCPPPPNPELLFGDYNLQPAGDVEVVKRAEDKQNAKEFFNIVQGTPAAEKILFFLIQRFFPDQADEWLMALSGPDKDGIIMQLIAILQAIPQDELTPDQQNALASVIASAQSVVGNGANPNIPQAPGAAASGTAPQGNAGPQVA